MVDPPEDIVAVRYVERRNGAAYGKTRDFETFIELLKFMRFAFTDPGSAIRRLRAGPGPTPQAVRRVSGSLRFGDRNALGRR